jgi:hypothetical protein
MTKAIILIKRTFDPKTTVLDESFTADEAIIYIHGDGYPDEKEHNNLFLPIWRYCRHFLEKRGYFDSEYLLARLVQHLANIRDLQQPSVPPFTGIGIQNCSWDIIDCNYIYIISETAVTCYDKHTMKIVRQHKYV